MRGKTIVITGAFGFLGKAVSEAAKAKGATIAMLDIRTGDQTITSPDLAIALDLADAAAASKAMQSVRDKTGKIDAILNIAGGFAWETFGDGDLATFDKMYKINVVTCITATKAALPHLVEAKGAVVNVGAASALKADTGVAAYTASKQGVMKFTESLAAEYKGKVRANAVLPSLIDTPVNRKDMPNSDFSTWVSPAELANVMLFLASDEASAITGALVPVVGRV